MNASEWIILKKDIEMAIDDDNYDTIILAAQV